MTPEEFRMLALSFPQAVEGRHFDTADFRVGKKIFATLRESGGRAVLKLSPDEQRLLGETGGGVFAPVKGSWGLKGWTQVKLDGAEVDVVRHAMSFAWRSVAPKTLLKALA